MKSPGPPGPTSLHNRRLGLRRRKLARLDHGLKSGRFVTAVTEGLVRRMSATTEADRGAARQIERLALHVVDRELSLDPQRAVVPYGNLCFCQWFLPVDDRSWIVDGPCALRPTKLDLGRPRAATHGAFSVTSVLPRLQH